MEWFNTIPGIDNLHTTEGFFDFFKLPYDPAIIVAKRMHIMGDFHQRLAAVISVPLAEPAEGEAGAALRNQAHWSLARHLLEMSYQRYAQAADAAPAASGNSKRFFHPLEGLAGGEAIMSAIILGFGGNRL
ncbi:nitrogenase-stabilizing/protective protein NifW [Acerihabitans sp. KWT182]|uniref:Nitrogenase-stabilizing/protective protein NifW n=1 Tax=Acerihabitans sp. KWT182 TaxID=3157919 RepID=A0AAU7Q4Q0_9GAMM